MTPTPRRFTGWHMTGILVAFFGVVIAVNLLMARMAIGTFGGTVVDNSYVASQRYNSWLEAARVQQRLGWTVAAQIDAERRVVVRVTGQGGPVQGARATAILRHPLGREPERTMTFTDAGRGDGTLRSRHPVPPGRWHLDLVVVRGDAVHRSRIALQ